MDTATDILARAVRLHQSGALAAAAPLYRDALAQDADNPSALYLYGLLGLQQGSLEQAGQCLVRADTLRPHHLGTRAALAELRLRQGATQQAERADLRATSIASALSSGSSGPKRRPRFTSPSSARD